MVFDVRDHSPAEGNMTASRNSTIVSQTITGGNDTNTGNMTETTGSTTTPSDEPQLPYIVSGDWRLDVQDGNVSSFDANFTMVHTDGTGRHAHQVTDFQSPDAAAELVDDGVTFVVGTSNLTANGEDKWSNVTTLIVIENLNAASISLTTEDDHFMGQALYGIVDSLTDKDGNEMIQAARTSQAGDPTLGNLTQGTENAINQTGNFLGNVSEGIQDFFNGTE